MDHPTFVPSAAGRLSVVDALPDPIHIQTEAVDDDRGARVTTIVCRRGRVVRRIQRRPPDGVRAVDAQHADVVRRLEGAVQRRARRVPLFLLEWVLHRAVEFAWPLLGTPTLRSVLEGSRAALRGRHAVLDAFVVTDEAHVVPSVDAPDELPGSAVEAVALWVAHLLDAVALLDPGIVAATPIRLLTAAMKEPLERIGFHRAVENARGTGTRDRFQAAGPAVIGHVVPVRMAFEVVRREARDVALPC